MSLLRALAMALALSGAAAALASSATAQQAHVVLTGTVVDERGEPVPAATVEARGPLARTGVTDARGAYRLGRVPVGSYRVRVQALGYRPRSGR